MSDFEILSIPTAGATTGERLLSLRNFLDHHVPYRNWLANSFVLQDRKAVLSKMKQTAKWMIVLNIQEPQPFNWMQLNNHK
ncbi:hypothetical protein Pmar_PMAR022923, partial [Perkinsus marinus ATCC 50983]